MFFWDNSCSMVLTHTHRWRDSWVTPGPQEAFQKGCCLAMNNCQYSGSSSSCRVKNQRDAPGVYHDMLNCKAFLLCVNVWGENHLYYIQHHLWENIFLWQITAPMPLVLALGVNFHPWPLVKRQLIRFSFGVIATGRSVHELWHIKWGKSKNSWQSLFSPLLCWRCLSVSKDLSHSWPLFCNLSACRNLKGKRVFDGNIDFCIP